MGFFSMLEIRMFVISLIPHSFGLLKMFESRDAQHQKRHAPQLFGPLKQKCISDLKPRKKWHDVGP